MGGEGVCVYMCVPSMGMSAMWSMRTTRPMVRGMSAVMWGCSMERAVSVQKSTARTRSSVPITSPKKASVGSVGWSCGMVKSVGQS